MRFLHTIGKFAAMAHKRKDSLYQGWYFVPNAEPLATPVQAGLGQAKPNFTIISNAKMPKQDPAIIAS